MSAAAAAKLIGVTRQAVNNRWKSGKLLGFIVNGNVLFPSWQFDAKAPESVVEGLDEVLLILAERDRSTLDQIFWLTSPRPEFDDASPIEALRHGKKDAVAAQARGAGVS